MNQTTNRNLIPSTTRTMNNKGTLLLSVFLFLEVSMEPCLKDLSEEAIAEFTWRLGCDEVSRNQFYQSFGLENRFAQKMFVYIGDIGKLLSYFPILRSSFLWMSVGPCS